MTPKYVPILRTMKGEFDALRNISAEKHRQFIPLFDISDFTAKKASQKKYQYESSPLECYLNNISSQISELRDHNPVMVDISKWPPNRITEGGVHVLPFVVNKITALGTPVTPIIGYDRWEDKDYQAALNLLASSCNKFTLRLEEYAFEDMAEEEHFLNSITDIIKTLNLDVTKCSVLLDFKDVTQSSISEIESKLRKAINLISPFGFQYISMAGCSVTTFVTEMVTSPDSCNSIVRREMVAWQSYTSSPVSEVKVVFGDYGIYPPNAQEGVIAPHANGKIKYTTAKHYFVARGHSKQQGNKGEQMYDLASNVIKSGSFSTEKFSWGDKRIVECSNKVFKGNATSWIAIDTNHHINFVLQEVVIYGQQLQLEKLVQI